jgi:hypothetical protein
MKRRYVYRNLQHQESLHFATQCIYVFQVILRTNVDYFHKQHLPADFIMATECVLCQVGNEIFYIIYLNVSLDGLSQPTDSTLNQHSPFFFIFILCVFKSQLNITWDDYSI